MNEDVNTILIKYSDEIQTLYADVRMLVMDSISQEVEEKLWAKIPSYYVGENFVRLIPFKDHINIEASAIMQNKDLLKQFKITPKGMLQINLNQSIPKDTLKMIFSETLLK